MRRRELIVAIGGAVAWPLALRAQQASLRRIAVLIGFPQDNAEAQKWVKAFLDGLSPLGWRPDTNLHIDWRFTSDPAQMEELAKEVVQTQPDLIVSTTTPWTGAVLRETHTIPVVFAAVSDPVGSGFVQSVSRPGGNATGFINIEASVAGKWLEVLKEIAPSTARVAVVFNPKTAPQSFYYLQALRASAETLGFTVVAVQVATTEEVEAAINDLAKIPDSGLVLTPDIFTATQPRLDLIISLASRLHIPAVYPFVFYVKAGGLVSYGADNTDLLRRATAYVDRVLKGEKPEDLPVQLPTKFELAINTRTAATMGLKFPASLLATADEVIE